MTSVVDPETGREVTLVDAFAYNGQYEVKATGYRGTAAAGVITNLDFAIGAEARYINGLRLILNAHAIGDTLEFMVADPDGNLPVPYRVAFPDYPVLKQFGYAWNVDHTKADQGRDLFNYVAKVSAGFYIRVRYTSTGTDPVDVKLNCFMHKKLMT